MHSFSEVEGASTGDMIGLVARFRNEAIYGQDVAPVRGVRAHLKLYARTTTRLVRGIHQLYGSGIEMILLISCLTRRISACLSRKQDEGSR